MDGHRETPVPVFASARVHTTCARGEFTAAGDMAAERANAYVARDQVSYDTWNKLRGIDDPRRTT